MTIEENLSYLKYFGLNITLYKSLNKLFKDNNYILRKNTEIIEKYLICSTQNSFNNFKKNNFKKIHKKNNNLKSNDTIWTIWWQGEKRAPYIVKKCINSMRKHSNGHKVIVIDKTNYRKYIDIPGYIIKRYEEGKRDSSRLKNIVLSNALIADIIRCGLLVTYGGIWSDATVLFSKDVENKIFKKEWFTLGQDNLKYIGEGKWSTFFFACKANNILIKYIFNSLCEYWKNNKYYINYLMLDYFIDIAYKNKSSIYSMINSSPNSKPLTLNRNYNNIADPKRLQKFILKQGFHKLSYKWWITGPLPVERKKGKITVYGYLKQNYFY